MAVIPARGQKCKKQARSSICWGMSRVVASRVHGLWAKQTDCSHFLRLWFLHVSRYIRAQNSDRKTKKRQQKKTKSSLTNWFTITKSTSSKHWYVVRARHPSRKNAQTATSGNLKYSCCKRGKEVKSYVRKTMKYIAGKREGRGSGEKGGAVLR